jgi:hypothetical protein
LHLFAGLVTDGSKIHVAEEAEEEIEAELTLPASKKNSLPEVPPKPSVVVTKTEDTSRHIQTFLRVRPLSDAEIVAEDQTPFLTVRQLLYPLVQHLEPL